MDNVTRKSPCKIQAFEESGMDIFCGELKKAVRKGKEPVWEFIQPYLKSKKEFEIRFGIVMLFHYIDEEHIDSLLK